MKKIAALFVLAVGLLGGCGLLAPYDGPDPAQPRITFEQGTGETRFSVTPRELVFKKRGEVKITWSLDADAKLKFAARDGIFIDGEVKTRVQVVEPNTLARKEQRALGASDDYLDPQQTEIGNCEVAKDRLSVTCVNKHTRAGKFKYSVRLTDGTKDYLLDPIIDNW